MRSFSVGATGRVVREIRLGLKAAGYAVSDGYSYDSTLAIAVRTFQQQPGSGLDVTGQVDDATWTKLFPEIPWPTAFDRCLQVTAWFEAHGYLNAAGNYDNAGITWGIIGFTLVNKNEQGAIVWGPLQPLLLDIYAKHKAVMEAAFDKVELADLIKALGKKPVEAQLWADGISAGTSKAKLIQAWSDAFRQLGADTNVQAMQDAAARKKYFDRASAMASTLEMETDDLSVLLLFDIVVQSKWGKDAQLNAVLQEFSELNLTKVQQPERRCVVLRRASATVLQEYWGNFFRRKSAVSIGRGYVRDLPFDLGKWGFDISALPKVDRILLTDWSSTEASSVRVAEAAIGHKLYAVERTAECAGELRDEVTTGVTSRIKSTIDAGLRRIPGRSSIGFGGLALRFGTTSSAAAQGVLAWMQWTLQQPVRAWVIGVRAAGDSAVEPLFLTNLPKTRSAQRRVGLRSTKKTPGVLSVFGVSSTDQPLVGVPHALSECDLVLFPMACGIPIRIGLLTELHREGIAIQSLVKRYHIHQRAPLVLGWYGGSTASEHVDIAKAAEHFWAAVRAKAATADALRTVIDTDPTSISLLWAQAMWASRTTSLGALAFTSPLWFDGFLGGVGALHPNGDVFHAKRDGDDISMEIVR